MAKNVKKINTFTMKCEIFGIVFSFEYSSRPYGFHQKGEIFLSRPTCVYCLFSQPHVIREFHHHARVGTLWRPSEASVGTIPDIGPVNVESATGGFVDLQRRIWDDICSRQSIRFITVEPVSEKQLNIYTIYTLCNFFCLISCKLFFLALSTGLFLLIHFKKQNSDLKNNHQQPNNFKNLFFFWIQTSAE